MIITVFENGKPVDKEISTKEFQEIREKTDLVWRNTKK